MHALMGCSGVRELHAADESSLSKEEHCKKEKTRNDAAWNVGDVITMDLIGVP